MQNIELAATLSVSISTISFWRTGRVSIPGPVSLLIRMLMDMTPEARERYLKRTGRDDV